MENLLHIWQLHPQSCRIEKAEKTLKGNANEDGLKWCGPYAYANATGWWVYPPLDVDFIWRGNNTFEHNIINEWNNDEVSLIRNLIQKTDTDEEKIFPQNFGGRMKIDFGRVEPNVAQIWTGLVFQTPPGWALHIRSPININMDAHYRIMEGILETDWLRYDIWINVAVQRENVLIQLRRDQQLPLAQLVPIHRDSYGKWETTENLINRNSPEADKVYQEWNDYNRKKYILKPPKDSGTYHKERARHSGKRISEPNITPIPDQCPFNKLPKVTPKKFIINKKDKDVSI